MGATLETKITVKNAENVRLFEPKPTYRMRGGGRSSLTSGQNIHNGVKLNFWIKEQPEKGQMARLIISNPAGQPIALYQSGKQKKNANDEDSDETDEAGENSKDELDNLKPRNFEAKAGVNSVNWDMRVDGAESFSGMVIWGGGLSGPLVVPGTYSAKLEVGDHSSECQLEILPDPRISATAEDLQDQYDFLIGVRDKLTETHEGIETLRDARNQLQALNKRLGDQQDYKELVAASKEIISKLDGIEKKLYQTQNQSPQDPLNFPIRLNNRLSALVGVVAMGNNAPTKQAISVRDVLIGEIDEQLAALNEVLATDIPELNSAVLKAEIPAIWIKDN